MNFWNYEFSYLKEKNISTVFVLRKNDLNFSWDIFDQIEVKNYIFTFVYLETV